MASGYVLCPCCGYDTVADDDTVPELCSDCEEAGCDDSGEQPCCCEELDDSEFAGDGTHTSTSYGVMPDRDLFDRAFDARCPDGTFSFGNDPYVGNDSLTASQLWRELQTQHATWESGEHKDGCPGDGSCNGDGCPCEDAGSWCSCVLGILGFEWI